MVLRSDAVLRLTVRLVLAPIAFTLFAVVAFAKLPPPTEEAKAKAAAVAAKSAWDDKMTTYQTCAADERVAEMYREALRTAGQIASPPAATPPCIDPGPYVTPGTTARPLEASGAHSPPETANAPPSSPATQKEISEGTQ